MPACLHGEIEITDPEAYEEYRRKVPATIARAPGRSAGFSAFHQPRDT